MEKNNNTGVGQNGTTQTGVEQEEKFERNEYIAKFLRDREVMPLSKRPTNKSHLKFAGHGHKR